MEFLDIPLFDDDVFKMIVRFVINIFFLTIIIRYLYYESSKRKDYVFTYYMIAIIVFFLCFTLKKLELDLGMALGLFAIFGIIRYRTNPIQIKEMTYLFVIIGISVINSLANKKMSYAELLLANTIVVLSLYIIEKIWLLKQETIQKIIYNNIENTKPQNRVALKEDLEERTGLKINRIEIGNINFAMESVVLMIYYYKGKQQ